MEKSSKVSDTASDNGNSPSNPNVIHDPLPLYYTDANVKRSVTSSHPARAEFQYLARRVNLPLKSIAAILGVGYSTVKSWLTHPDNPSARPCPWWPSRLLKYYIKEALAVKYATSIFGMVKSLNEQLMDFQAWIGAKRQETVKGEEVWAKMQKVLMWSIKVEKTANLLRFQRGGSSKTKVQKKRSKKQKD